MEDKDCIHGAFRRCAETHDLQFRLYDPAPLLLKSGAGSTTF